MNIHECARKIKDLALFLDKRDTYAAISIICVGAGSFFLGKLSVEAVGNRPINIIQPPECPAKDITYPEPKQTQNTGDSGRIKAFVGSRSGSKYHLPDCPGAKMISEANKIWFSNKIDAEKAGYSPAGNCKGL